MVYKSNLDFIQLLFALDVDIDDGLHKLHLFLLNNKDRIISANLPRLYKSVMGASKNRLEKKDCKPKDLCHILFQTTFLDALFETNILYQTTFLDALFKTNFLCVSETFRMSREALRFNKDFFRDENNFEQNKMLCEIMLRRLESRKEYFEKQEVDEQLIEELRVEVSKTIVNYHYKKINK